MKNYLTIWQRWRAAKLAVLTQHERVTPFMRKIVADIKAVSSQDLPAYALPIPGTVLMLFPALNGGFAYSYSGRWREVPNPAESWNCTLAEAEASAAYLASLQEEEIRQLFRVWSEKAVV